MSQPTIPPTIPAATVILMRDQPQGPPLILMAERAQALAFAGGALVFPGGRVDTADITTARTSGLAHGFETLEDADAAGRITAARETLEETGLLLSSGPAPAAHALAHARQALAEGPDSAEACTYAALLAGLGHHVDAQVFTPFGIWEPPAAAPIKRRFHTRFYIADASANQQSATPDGHEAVALHWLTARQVLDRAATELVFPTRCMLARLAQYQSAAAAIADASNHFIQPEITTRDGTPWITIPENKGYPWTGEPLASVRRE
ncbi:8-oxo-dGTP pyrophosphatase MutT (NUDIX family) [Polymorphobacter multimanifer]|uniref:8-oxo-dGTP pyrophosphatase MutT (NUDIX family) n=1 Tax=Polymorphobacter multimanifer TaxID=1070431 RepID=A0A841LAK6_9SPHN|nr:NUDIX hydrolase [Polymorphobacter multimanifer]MBB6229166.1 8-oxo-dGTP pyrophosphatase MutT (NUDIX family) [Polymorphobacter multimanifer]